MSYRFELKYYLKSELLNLVLSDLMKFCELDKFCDKEKKFYTVNSIYMDNHQMNSYREKIAGKKNRTKIRFRNYQNTTNKNINKYNLELKIRSADKLKKLSTELNFPELAPKENLIKKKNFVLRFVALMEKFENYKKKVFISYDRIALFEKKNRKLRFTIDKNLYARKYISDNNYGMKVKFVPNNYKILEIKTDKSIPFWFSYIIKKYGLMKMPISKYALAVQSLSYIYSLEL